eukprot:c24339_g2_i1 orf=132-467(+)
MRACKANGLQSKESGYNLNVLESSTLDQMQALFATLNLSNVLSLSFPSLLVKLELFNGLASQILQSLAKAVQNTYRHKIMYKDTQISFATMKPNCPITVRFPSYVKTTISR